MTDTAFGIQFWPVFHPGRTVCSLEGRNRSACSSSQGVPQIDLRFTLSVRAIDLRVALNQGQSICGGSSEGVG